MFNNILQVKYTYDHLNQLIREDNKERGITIVYTYDANGNRTRREEYDFNTGTLSGSGSHLTAEADRRTAFVIHEPQLGVAIALPDQVSALILNPSIINVGDLINAAFKAFGYKTEREISHEIFDVLLIGLHKRDEDLIRSVYSKNTPSSPSHVSSLTI